MSEIVRERPVFNHFRASERSSNLLILSLLCTLSSTCGYVANGAQLLTLSPENYDRYAPQGNEVDAIFGDYVLRNDRITVVVANPDLITGRSSSRWAIAHVAGCVIDIARHNHSGEALTAFYPGVTRYKPDAPQRQQDFVQPESFAQRADRKAISGKQVRLTIPEIELGSRRSLADLAKLPPSQHGAPSPTMRVLYTLADGWDAVKVETIYRNPSAASLKWQPHCVLRVDPASDAGNGIVRTVVGRAENSRDGKAQFCWSYDRWFRQACGVLTLSPGVDADLTIPRQLRSEVGQITLLPGGEYRVRRWLIASRDVFAIKDIANELLQHDSQTVRLLVSDGKSPVPNVFVTAKLGEVDYASGWTDDNGTLDMSLPVLAKSTNNRWTLHLQPAGVNSTSVKLSPDTEAILEVRVKKAARLLARVVDETSSPIPCRLRLQGVGNTPDHDFFPSTSETAVRNALHLTDGQIDHPIAIGQYDMVITRGPEYDAIVRHIIVRPGERVSVNATLKRVVQTPDWISADLHNHSTVTGTTERFYIKGYRKNPTVDGDSTASQLGRVRNLLAEHIEFAVPTEHNQVSSFDSHIKRLGAEKFIATVPGVGLTAGRRHTLTHQNAFPVPFRRGDLDGGMLQRPQHIGQLDWLNRWNTATERFVQIMFPQGTKLFINRKMDAVEIESLEPLIGDSLAGESRVLEWLDRLREGYRIPAVLNSGAFDNYPGCGRQRTYIRCQTDDPAAFRRSGLQTRPSLDQKGLVAAGDPIHGLVANAKAGHLLLTNGPFLEASLQSSNGDVVAFPGDSIRTESGDVTLHVRVQCSNQYDIDRIQVLINGRRDAALDFRKESHTDFFRTGVVKFQRKTPLNLSKDAFVIVVASGHAVPLASRDQTRQAIAMTNPFWIDSSETGYRPHSPLDDSVETRLQFLQPLLARANAVPGRVRVNLTNHGDQIARDSIRLDFDPPDAIEVLGTRDRMYAIPPSGETFIDFEIRLADDYLATGLPIIPNTYVDKNLGIRTLRSSKGQGRTPGSTRVHVDHSGMRLPNLKTLADVPAALRNRLVFPIRSRRKEQLADVQFADAGEHLAVLGKVHDANVIRKKIAWQGSCIEIYGAMPKQKPIGRILLTPKVGKHKTAAYRVENGSIVASAEIACESRPTASGYQLWALVPWKLLPVEPRAEQVLLEFRVSAATAKGGPHQRTDLFRAGAPHVDHGLYGRIRFEGQVGAELAILKLFENKRHARIRLRLKNRTQQTLRDRVTLCLTPSGLARFAEQSESSGTTTANYNLEPGAETTREFDVNLLPDANAARLLIEVEDSPAGQVIAVQPLEMQVTEHRLPQVAGVTRLEDIEARLADIPPWLMFDGDRILTRLRFSVSDSHLALSAQMIDPAPQPHETAWKGSCLEVFGTSPKKEEAAVSRIGQLFLTPGTATKPANGSRQSGRLQVKEPRIKVRSKPTKSGYLLEALIPLELLHFSSTTGGRLEFQSTVFSNRSGDEVTRTTLFGSERAYQNTAAYGQFLTAP